MPDLARIATARNGPGAAAAGTHRALTHDDYDHQRQDLLGQVLARDNLARAWHRVKSNKGAPGIDGVTIVDWPEHARAHWPATREQIEAGRYRPQAVRRVEIPKPDGGKRPLGIPTVTDRVIQQAIAQVLTPIFDPTFSDSSFGFRPGRNAHQAIRQVQAHVKAGYRWAVDIDLTKFLDRGSYCPQVHEAGSNKLGWSSNTLILKPFLRPWQTSTASSSPRLTRCNTVWRVTPRRLVASCMTT